MDCGQLPQGTFDLSISPAQLLSKQRSPAPRPPRTPSSSPPTTRPSRHDKQSSSSSAGSPASPASECKRRRFTSSPVRPWKSPSPADHSVTEEGTSLASPASSLLRHISVIRETPPILKPQVMAASYHHASHHHYHPLVDPYAAAYHLYKSTPAPGGPMAAGAAAATASTGHPHHWGSYN